MMWILLCIVDIFTVEKTFLLNICVSYFCVSVRRHHDQGKLQNRELFWGLQFQRVRDHNGRAESAGARQLEQVEGRDTSGKFQTEA